MGAPKNAAEAEKAKRTERDLLRAGLAISSLGTSEIKTGGGEYGDETLADSLFPKSINNWALADREEARRKVDADKAAMSAPPRAPDLADKLLEKAPRGTKTGRKSTFISGAYGIK